MLVFHVIYSKLYNVVNQIIHKPSPMFFNKWLVYLKKKVMVCLFQQRLQPKSLQRESCTSALSALWRSSNQLHSACRKWGEEQLWMDVDGSAKSESPVDRWLLYVFYHFYPIIWDGFQPSVWWCRISLAHPQYHCRDEI